MNGGKRNVQGINGSLLWKRSLGNQRARQLKSRLIQPQHPNLREHLKAVGCGLWISRTRLLNNSLRNEQVAVSATILPPIPRELLVRGDLSGHCQAEQ